MKTLSPSKKRGTGLAPTFISIAIFFAAAVAVPAHAVTVANQNASSGSSARQSTNQAATGPYTPAVSEIVKLFDAGVDKSVIVAYINNSSVAYRLTASEIIALKDHGVPSEIVTVMLQHNAELKTQQGSNQSQTAAYNQPPAATAPYATPPVYPAYDYSYPQYVYSYPYSYGGYYDYGWPYIGASFSFGFYPCYGYYPRSYCYPWGYRYGCGLYAHHYPYPGSYAYRHHYPRPYHAYYPSRTVGRSFPGRPSQFGAPVSFAGPMHASFGGGGRSAAFHMGGSAARGGGFSGHMGGFGGRGGGGGFASHGGGSRGGGRR